MKLPLGNECWFEEEKLSTFTHFHDAWCFCLDVNTWFGFRMVYNKNYKLEVCGLRTCSYLNGDVKSLSSTINISSQTHFPLLTTTILTNITLAYNNWSRNLAKPEKDDDILKTEILVPCNGRLNFIIQIFWCIWCVFVSKVKNSVSWNHCLYPLIRENNLSLTFQEKFYNFLLEEKHINYISYSIVLPKDIF